MPSEQEQMVDGDFVKEDPGAPPKDNGTKSVEFWYFYRRVGCAFYLKELSKIKYQPLKE